MKLFFEHTTHAAAPVAPTNHMSCCLCNHLCWPDLLWEGVSILCRKLLASHNYLVGRSFIDWFTDTAKQAVRVRVLPWVHTASFRTSFPIPFAHIHTSTTLQYHPQSHLRYWIAPWCPWGHPFLLVPQGCGWWWLLLLVASSCQVGQACRYVKSVVVGFA